MSYKKQKLQSASREQWYEWVGILDHSHFARKFGQGFEQWQILMLIDGCAYMKRSRQAGLWHFVVDPAAKLAHFIETGIDHKERYGGKSWNYSNQLDAYAHYARMKYV